MSPRTLLLTGAVLLSMAPAASASPMDHAVEQLRAADQLHARAVSGSTKLIVDQTAQGQRMALYVGGKLRRISYIEWAQRPRSGQPAQVVAYYSKEMAFDRCFRVGTSAKPWVADVTPFSLLATAQQALKQVTPDFPRLKHRRAGKFRTLATFSRRLPGRRVARGSALIRRSTGRLMRLDLRRGSKRDYVQTRTTFSYTLRNAATVPADQICGR